MRASYYLAPVLMGVFGHASVPLPGGCDIGARPIDQTLKAMRTLGANADTLGGNLEVSAEELIGNDIFLDMPSVGATVNSMLTAVNASGTTCIHNAAKEPHIVEMCIRDSPYIQEKARSHENDVRAGFLMRGVRGAGR